ncbi:MAG: Fic family protein [Candidatus Algichlamydia australiensis]|nr:Fic family protein [Chlamydiales bacterium]
MPWNWQLEKWPRFTCDLNQLIETEKKFLLAAGRAFAYIKTLDKENAHRIIVEILSLEGIESSKIEGEYLDRESLQSSIRAALGLNTQHKKPKKKESDMAELMFAIYETFDEPLTHKMLFKWHSLLFQKESHLSNIGNYRVHKEPMQIVSHKCGSKKIFFEAPPSHRVRKEMDEFVKWFNQTRTTKSILARAAIAHIYFESIHPFEDGNGRIGRVLVEKILSQGVGDPILIAVSQILEKRKKEYYAELQKCNYSLDANDWVQFFSQVILQAQESSLKLLHFVINKSKTLSALSGKINGRQEKILLRIFAEGPKGFQGGLSAENYISITKCSRATATRDLNDLIEKGALQKTGSLKHTRYSLVL